LTVARETLTEIICERHSVDPFGVLKIGDELARSLVNNHHVIAAGKENAMSVGINSEVIPSAVTADRNSTHYLVATSIVLRHKSAPANDRQRTSNYTCQNERSGKPLP